MVLVSVTQGCKKDETPTPNDLTFYGSDNYQYNSYQPFSNKPITVYYHIPENATSATPIFVVLPGASRDALAQRNNLVNAANAKDFIALVLEFGTNEFPGSDSYNLANIFDDGDNPSTTTLNDPSQWTFSVIDSIFADFATQLGSAQKQYDLIGFSAGAQLAHRFLFFSNQNSINRLLVASAGWYNLPTDTLSFPYGFKNSPAAGIDLQPIFAKRVTILVGTADTDPNSANLRHTPEADAQGNNRLERAQYFYQFALNQATSLGVGFAWNYASVPQADHDGATVIEYGANLLY